MKIGGQGCTFSILLSQPKFIKEYLGRKYNFELGILNLFKNINIIFKYSNS